MIFYSFYQFTPPFSNIPCKIFDSQDNVHTIEEHVSYLPVHSLLAAIRLFVNLVHVLSVNFGVTIIR